MSRGGGATLTARIQAGLTRYYGIESAPDVDQFVTTAPDSARETLVVRELAGVMEMALALPRAVLDGGPVTLDDLCQAVEGVSHFLYLAERARRELPATQLELEIQAEIDKYLLLAIVPHAPIEHRAIFEPRRAVAMREHLFERVAYVHEAGSEHGERYRLANRIAARFARRLETTLALRGRFLDLQAVLRRFYAVGQTEKIELALAA